MTAFRRVGYNFALERTTEWCKELGKPLVVLEPLKCNYRWASDRLHRFVIEGMADNAAELDGKDVLYYPYLEPEPGADRGLLRELASRACVVVGDDFPSFFLPRMMQAAARQIPVQFELVDSNGLLPLRATDKVFARAFDLRRYLQKELLPHLSEVPKSHPVSYLKFAKPPKLPTSITNRWPMAEPARLMGKSNFLADFPIDHQVQPTPTQGGSQAAGRTLEDFLANKLSRYGEERNQPEQQVTSGLSPYLHFGHLSVHEVFEKLTSQIEWSPGDVAPKANGSSSGWWGTSETVESFLDELITWRELGYNMSSKCDNYTEYESLPDWAQQTLEEHVGDKRSHVYSLEEFETGATHDPLWNAAQLQLVRDGVIHNYLRMLWGKKILEWSESPRQALDVMIELNNKYALDGRNPNSYSGIFWVLGRYDRPWGPERPIYGKIRYMTSENTARKVKVKNYIKKYSAGDKQRELDF